MWKLALRRTDAGARELEAIVDDMERLDEAGELLAISDRNGVLPAHHRAVRPPRGERHLRAPAHSQLVRFQFRTVLAPGRPQRSLAEHRRIVAAIEAGDRAGAEQAMRDHLANVAATLRDDGPRAAAARRA